MGLAAHLEGVMNGAFLVALGAIWSGLKLSSRQTGGGLLTVLYGTYANWATTTLAAILVPLRCHRSRPPATVPNHGRKSSSRWAFVSVGLAIIRGVDWRALVAGAVGARLCRSPAGLMALP